MKANNAPPASGMYKWIGLAAVLLLLMWGLSEITALVAQRQEQRQVAVQGIAKSLAGPQTLMGPVLKASCTEERLPAPGEALAVGPDSKRDFVQLAAPSVLDVDGRTQLETRSRGLHSTQVYNWQSKIKAQWSDLSALQPKGEWARSRIQCGNPVLLMAVSDARGIRQVELTLNGKAQTVQSGTQWPTYPRGVHVELPADWNRLAPLMVDVNLELVGTEGLGLVPLGTATKVNMQSNWPHPSFNGQFLPSERSAPTAAGFGAQWRVSALASTAQQDVQQGRPLCGPSSDSATLGNSAGGGACVEMLGISFMDPSNTYVLSDRATKYGLLFIVLTFVAVGLFEVMRSLRVHPVQYLLVGAAISVFFLLLVSLSEKLPFHVAYALAASACVLLLGYYASHMLSSWKRGLPFGAGIAVLYGLLYVLLQMEKDALMVGSLALFGVLTLVMVLTRNLDWYAQLQSWVPAEAKAEASKMPNGDQAAAARARAQARSTTQPAPLADAPRAPNAPVAVPPVQTPTIDSAQPGDATRS